MKASAKLLSTPIRSLWTDALLLALVLSAGSPARAQVVTRGELPGGAISKASGSAPAPARAESLASDTFRRVTRYPVEFDGDHSLNAAIVVEHTSNAGFTRYTVRLQLASGAEQSIAVTAPPGGLQPEMCDMNGDKVPNDLLLIPKLFRWPPTVLLNDGHDHFAVAISDTPPGVAARDRASGAHHVEDTAVLVSSRFRPSSLANAGRPFLSLRPPRKAFLSTVARTLGSPSANPPHSGRAPPALVAQT